MSASVCNLSNEGCKEVACFCFFAKCFHKTKLRGIVFNFPFLLFELIVFLPLNYLYRDEVQCNHKFKGIIVILMFRRNMVLILHHHNLFASVCHLSLHIG